ncbi:hypothetical protein Vretifemale_19989, partial [Volvox reticuliferus]
MENYTRIHKPRDDGPAAENEVRVRSTEQTRFYVSLGLNLLREKGHRAVVLKAMGKAINKTVAIAEVLKRRVAGLHQLSETSSMTLVDEYEPNEEGLDPIQVSRNVSVLTITLSLDQPDTTHPGYQPPLPADQVKPDQPPRGAAAAPAGGGEGATTASEELVLDEVEQQLLEDRSMGRGRGGGRGGEGGRFGRWRGRGRG